MIADKIRTGAYARAIRQTVKPGSVVLDVGTGTGILALIACQAGARRVYAIEPDNIINVAKRLARTNGYADQIKFIQDVSTKVTLPEKVDVIVSDIRGILPMLGQSLVSIADARQRLLAPGGALIPSYDQLWGTAVEAPDLYRNISDPWDNNGYDLDMRAARRLVTNAWRKGRVSPEQFLSEPQCWGTLDYSTLESPHVRAELTWNVTRTGTAHGLSLWFDSCLAEGISFSNAPTEFELIYGSAFFPLTAPILVATGDTVSVSLAANLVGADYVWGWNTLVLSQGMIKADFKQSTFFANILHPEQLRKISATHVPSLNDDGEVDRFILNLMDARNSLKEIALRLSERFPDRFAGSQDALTKVSELSLKYS